ncbi:MAG: FKBP-type peptidyl-prolyl cis-trans isomerase [Bacteroidales bacterium]|nr:FKBP-type peptidyl-prolyl cis-trans isomerase [Bacteroidales bacterium]
MNDSLILNPLVVAKAMWESEKGNPKMDDEAARTYIMMFISKRDMERSEKQAEMNKEIYRDYINENQTFLAKNRERSDVTVTESGLQYEVIKMGSGPKPTLESTVKVHYVGILIDGSEFDSSVGRGSPAQFPLNGVISGWTEALQLMPVGSKFKLYLPESIAYGPGGAGDVIKPYSTLIFEVELLEIVQ